ncbi:hypothetical protein [Yersinia sp. 2545 StPb PI]|uniref:hypothetical protein n=1 Tax=Yersinia sp. 2545 StPb PI TaxID=3117410 RepID=UPI003FA41732
MACECFDEVSAKMKLHILERRGNEVAEVAESGFAHSALVFAEGDFCSVRLPYTFRFYKHKQNCHPTDQVKYFGKDGQVIADYTTQKRS